MSPLVSARRAGSREGSSPVGSPNGASSELACRLLGWFGLLMIVVGFADIALAWYPLMSGNPEWEFGIVSLTVWSLPLPTTGFVALLVSSVLQGNRWRVRGIAITLLFLAVAVLALLTMFLLVVPIALGGVPDEAVMGVRKTIVKTLILGVAFPAAYLVLGISALRHLRKSIAGG